MYNLKTKEDKMYYFKNISKKYKTWNKEDLRANILDFIKITEQEITINLDNKTKIELQNIYKELLSMYGVKKDKEIKNIIKYIEEKENKDIWYYNGINIITNDKKYNYKFIKSTNKYLENLFYEKINGSVIKNKSQIANRIQYIKQSGYKFKEYSSIDETLSIVFE